MLFFGKSTYKLSKLVELRKLIQIQNNASIEAQKKKAMKVSSVDPL